MEHLQELIFSDESRFVLGTDNRWVWRRRGEDIEEIYEKKDKFPESIMILAAVGKNFKSQIIIVDIKIRAKVRFYSIFKTKIMINYYINKIMLLATFHLLDLLGTIAFY